MKIRRIEVEEGFLTGLDLSLTDGLNVLVGPRGSGKTSVIELLRFALAVPGFTRETHDRAVEHALSVLGPGQVTVTIESQGHEFVFQRTAEEERPRVSGEPSDVLPMILSQGEIERVGLDAQGRLRIIDQFRPASPVVTDAEMRILAEIDVVSSDVEDVTRSIAIVEDELRGADEAKVALRHAVQAELESHSTLERLASERERLHVLSRMKASLAVRRETVDQLLTEITGWKRLLQRVKTQAPRRQTWPSSAGTPDVSIDFARRIDSSVTAVQQAIDHTDQAIERLDRENATTREREVSVDQEARSLRRLLEEHQEGAGARSQEVARLRERVNKFERLETLALERKSRLKELHEHRSLLLDELDQVRERRFEERQRVAQLLNAELGPSVDVRLTRYGLHTDYASRIAASLRGSQIRYNALAALVAQALSPRELCEAVERNAPEQIAMAAGIPVDRARRVVAHLTQFGTREILTSPLEDSVALRLLDGREYKDTTRLSTGQRCTVVLPILLGHKGQALVVDQPEDHVDNAFIVSTLIKAMLSREHDSQLIFATHNANIPVLGNARQVVFLGSDGSRAFVTEEGALTKPAVVEGITRIMEGGREAFARRAQFYSELVVLDHDTR